MSRLSKHELTTELHRLVQRELRLDDRFTAVSNLQQSGLDSLALTRLLLAVEERLGVWIDESLLTPDNLENVESLAAGVHELRGGCADPTHGSRLLSPRLRLRSASLSRRQSSGAAGSSSGPGLRPGTFRSQARTADARSCRTARSDTPSIS